MIFSFLEQSFSVVVLFMFVLFSCKQEHEKPAEHAQEAVVAVASPKTIKTLNFKGLKSYLSAQDDVVHVVNFWATWCKPCVVELPYFEKINTEYKDNKVTVTLVSLDFPQKLESDLVPFVQEQQLKSEIILLDDPDENTWIPEVDDSWSGALPATLIYKNGARFFHEGTLTYEELEKQIQIIQ